MEQRVGNVEEIEERHVRRRHSGPASPKVDIYPVWSSQRHYPEQSTRVRVNPRIEVVDLICRVNLTRVEVQSNKGECPLVNIAVLPNIRTTRKPHIGIERQGLRGPIRVLRCSSPLNLGDANESIEVSQR